MANPSSGNEPGRNQENTKLSQETSITDATREKLRIEEANKRMHAVFGNKSMDYAQRGDFKASNIKQFFLDLIKEKKKNWSDKRREMIASNEYGTTEYSVQNLIDETASIDENLEKISTTIALYLERIAKESPNGKLMPADLERMMESQYAKVTQIEVILVKTPQLLDAFKWALGGSEKNEGGERSVSYGEAKAFNDLEENFDKGGYEKSVCWSIMGFMSQKDRNKFTKRYAENKNMDSAVLMEFLKEGNLMGVFATDEMESLIKDYAKDDKTEDVIKELKQNKNQYAINWKIQNDFYVAGQALMRTSYGSTNSAAEMMTPKNGAMLVGYIVAGTTIAANVLANVFVAGRLKDPSKLLEIAKNKYILGATAGIAVLNTVKDDTTIAEKFKGKETVEKEEEISARKNIRLAIKSNPDWNNFFEESDYSGARAMWDYIVFISDKDKSLPTPLLKVEAFNIWLDKMASDKDKGAKYVKLKEKFQGIKPKDEEFALLANAFNIMKIGKNDTQKQYKKATNFENA